MITAASCPVCGGTDINQFLRRAKMPVHQNLVMTSHQAALQVPRGDLELTICRDCGFLFNKAYEPAKLAYGADYDNIQTHSPYFSRYLSELADHLLKEKGVKNRHIVEVGCGKGEFLRLLVKDPSFGNSGIGFDPSYVGPESDLEGRLRFDHRYYNEECADTAAEVVVCRHVIEHVPQPLELLRAVRRALRRASKPRIYFETPCVEWILKNQVIWDFFYEHCSLFSSSSLRTAFERAGFKVLEVRHVFGGQYLWLEAELSDKPVEAVRNSGKIPQLGKLFAQKEDQLRNKWLARISHLAKTGKVAVWGAGAKGTTFVHLIDPENTLIDCVVDLNPNKQGKFVPGTGHQIVGVDSLFARGVNTAILMNPNYRAENESILEATGLNVRLIDK